MDGRAGEEVGGILSLHVVNVIIFSFNYNQLRVLTPMTLGNLVSHPKSPCTCRMKDFIMGVQKYLPIAEKWL